MKKKLSWLLLPACSILIALILHRLIGPFDYLPFWGVMLLTNIAAVVSWLIGFRITAQWIVDKKDFAPGKKRFQVYFTIHMLTNLLFIFPVMLSLGLQNGLKSQGDEAVLVILVRNALILAGFSMMESFAQIICLPFSWLRLPEVGSTDQERMQQREWWFAWTKNEELDKVRLNRGLHQVLEGVTYARNCLHNVERKMKDVKTSPDYLQVLTYLDRAIIDARQLVSYELTDIVQDKGLGVALNWYCQTIERLPVSFEVVGSYERLTYQRELIIYRIVQDLVHCFTMQNSIESLNIQMEQTNSTLRILLEPSSKFADCGTPDQDILMSNIQKRVDMLEGTLQGHNDLLAGGTVWLEFDSVDGYYMPA